ncbi:MAG: TRAP transporter substrate-binding protein DctP [Bacillota bacterium]
MKKGLLLISLMLMAIFLGACGNKEQASGGNGDEKTYELKFGGIMPEDHPNTIAMKKIAKEVEEQTDGRIKIKVFPASQLGDYTLMYEEIGKGTLDMGLMSNPSHLDSRQEMVLLPYLFKDYAQAEEQFKLDSFVGKKLQEIDNEQNIQLLGFHAQGFGGLGSKNEVKEPLNFNSNKGVLLRVPGMDTFIKNAEDLGFNTVPLPYADLYTALQAGTVEGWVGGHPQVNYMQFRDVINYYYQYNNFFEAHNLYINKNLWDSFTEEDRELFQKLADDMTALSFENAEKLEEEYRAKLKEEGIEVIEFTDGELQTLADYSRENSWSVAEETIGKDLLEELLEALK